MRQIGKRIQHLVEGKKVSGLSVVKEIKRLEAERDALRESLEEINTLCEISGIDSLVARAARKGLAALEHPPLVRGER